MDLAARPESNEPTSSSARSATGSRVLFVSGRHLVGDAIRVALESRGLEMVSPPATDADGEDSVEPFSRHRLAGWRVGAALVVGDFLTDAQREAVRGLPRLALPWLLLVEEPADPRWTDLVASGASTVVPSSIGLDELVRILDDLALGRPLAWPGREELEEEWRRRREEQEQEQQRMSSLSPRERSVLALLHDGLSVREVAELTGVREGTVRSQVKAVLRKLGVSSQLAAVALYDRWAPPADRP
ncbi:hypothetical protein NOK12_21830 [Nocardioides sp. OK12]|uniref:helix-turn-helix transcriptional regulator n=1 Tax=Nocardioides sp. OK12 TaxID=2758661 RepID=UPI0021C40BBC|nr:LuxR C-terminal-related transcriptional regulator [Nocardioides sp. OK12]GHJ59665.1 hypothetical protein NOK12_21830 [Nocardioides sp. OK12]